MLALILWLALYSNLDLLLAFTNPTSLFMYKCIVFALFLCFSQFASAQHIDDMPLVLSLRERSVVIDNIFSERFHTLLPTIMQEEGIDMWLIIAREYNEDPVIKTMLPATWLAARRRTILVIEHKSGAVEGTAVARYDVGDIFKSGWNPEEEPDQWKRLAEIISQKDPKKIGINISDKYGHADGLASTDYQLLKEQLSEKYRKRLVSAASLAVRWLETRTDKELATYEQICRIAHQIIAEGLSEQAIQPGVTTTTDVQWWYRERIAGLKLDTWFHPTVDITRPDTEFDAVSRSFSEQTKVLDETIMPGDLVHVDFGITYLRLNTDMQQNAYVLKPGESSAPLGLINALKQGNRLQDILTSQFEAGKSGNEILAATRKQAVAEELEPSIYSHPIGYHGHAAGPSIGMWDNQVSVPAGEFPLHENTCYAIELNTKVEIPEWNHKVIRMMLEETTVFQNSKVHYIDGRQEELYLIPRNSTK